MVVMFYDVLLFMITCVKGIFVNDVHPCFCLRLAVS